MNKPLSEWTLGEIKAECKRCNGNCIGAVCPMVKWISKDEMACVIIRELRKPTPASWDLSEPPRWTEQEAELAKALYELRRSISLVIGRSTGGILWWRDGDIGEGILPHKLFPSLNEGNCVRLDEIIGGGE